MTWTDEEVYSDLVTLTFDLSTAQVSCKWHLGLIGAIFPQSLKIDWPSFLICIGACISMMLHCILYTDVT